MPFAELTLLYWNAIKPHFTERMHICILFLIPANERRLGISVDSTFTCNCHIFHI
ncbi:hypothetical protein CKA32_007158 [Geitlerinema sp. FC II]|nr:hypothetical protein CKA32_007158 [Geitlerinema sp. FC II]